MKAVQRYKLAALRSEYRGCDVSCGDYSYHCCVVHLKVRERVDPKNSHHRGETFIFFIFVYI